MVQVYKEPLSRRYYGSIVGEAMLFRVLAYLSAIVLSIVVAYATGGFWIKLKPDNIQPNVHYTYDALLLFEGAGPGKEQVWSTSATINSMFPNAYVAANVEVAELDVNNDGLPDIIDFQASIGGKYPVHGVKALLQFTYELDGAFQLQMYTLAYLAYSSPMQGAALYTDGELTLQQKNQITEGKYNAIYNVPLLNSSLPTVAITVQPSIELQFQDIIKGYLSRNYTTVLPNNYPVWRAGSSNQFELNTRIRIPPNQIAFYRPKVIEMLKGGWIQWLATFIVLWYLLQWAEWFVFTMRLVSTRIVSDFQSKTQRF